MPKFSSIDDLRAAVSDLPAANHEVADQVAGREAQLTKPPQTDGRTLMAEYVDPAIYSKYIGQYLNDSGVQFTITKMGDRLFIECSVWPGGKYVLHPVSEKVFFLNFIDFQAQFVIGTDERVEEVLFISTGRDGKSTNDRAQRIHD